MLWLNAGRTGSRCSIALAFDLSCESSSVTSTTPTLLAQTSGLGWSGLLLVDHGEAASSE
jgi:hypothetical protein